MEGCVHGDVAAYSAELVTGFDMGVYESVFDTLIDTGNDPGPSTVDSVDTAELMPYSFMLNPDVQPDSSSRDVCGLLLAEYRITEPLCQRPTQLDLSVLIRFPFLDNFTKATGFIRSFECGTKQQRLLITSDPVNANPSRKPSALKAKTSDAVMHWVDMTQKALMLQNDRMVDPVVLLPVTHKIVYQIREIAITKHYQSSNELVWSTSVETLCYNFFNPANLQKNLALFWSFWYPNWPTIHRPSFEATEKTPELIAVMALIGACLSPDKREYASAQVWFDLVEDVVFSNNTFGDLECASAWNSRMARDRQSTQIDILQAAYCVCLYQTWEGCKRSKRRILRRRFNDLVYVNISAHCWMTC